LLPSSRRPSICPANSSSRYAWETRSLGPALAGIEPVQPAARHDASSVSTMNVLTSSLIG